MKKLIVLALLGLSAGAMAQTTAGGANNQSSSSATTSAQGNSQAVNFNTTNPSTVTQNVNSSGATTSTIDYRGSYTIKNVPSVNGPNLTTSNDTCMGSTSASANGPGVGLSFGTTWTDEHCKRLKMSRELWNKGMKAASLAMDCMDPAALAALEMTGTKCPQSMTAEERVSAYGPQASASGAPASPPRPVAAAPVAPVVPAAPPASPAIVPASAAPLPPPPAPVAEAAPQQVAAAPVAEQEPLAVTTPVASATVTPIDPRDAAAIRAAHLLDGRFDDGPGPRTVPQ
ncbi:hypothetical protein FHT32_001646 [Variovorax sp. SG517]|uniref:hypothetical protein n=1 Tax=Variovorax sp. SG517 TaxID=2587117 RepID=UPI00159E7FD4|nr:hypothetical protein [Variovorax sp. SG517]NVM88007.1 hypothetical protein [Variovorax sp. SG517]